MVFHRHDLFLMYEATKMSLQITRYTVNATEYYSDLYEHKTLQAHKWCRFKMINMHTLTKSTV